MLAFDLDVASIISIGMKRVLTSDPGAWVFAPQYPTQMDKVFRSAVVPANLKTILIDLKRDIRNGRSVEKLCGYGKFYFVVDTSLVMQVFFLRVLRGPVPDPTSI